jgi:hypothetical protein
MITAGICDQQNGELGVSLHSSNPDPVMSALGQKRTWLGVRPMSALPLKADITERRRQVRCVPTADIVVCHHRRKTASRKLCDMPQAFIS